MKKAVLYGITSSLFFASTFVLNRSMNLSGGSWMYSACLRYIFMLPMLFAVIKPSGAKAVHNDIKKNSKGWFLWRIIGFGLFYLPLSFASSFGAAWLVAGTWQTTIIAGALITPLWGKKIPYKMVFVSILIIVGVFILQLSSAETFDVKNSLGCIVPTLLAAFCYPLGNRKMMDVCSDELSITQRVYGMTLCSMPFWLVVAIIALVREGLPSSGQLLQSLAVALFSGVLGTVLFFRATDMVKTNEKQLAAVEATQAGEVVFTLLGSVLLLGEKLPGAPGLAGLAIIVAGMLTNSLIVDKN